MDKKLNSGLEYLMNTELPIAVKPSKITYKFNIDDVNKVLAKVVAVQFHSDPSKVEFHWNVTEQRDFSDRVTLGHFVTSVDVIVKG